MYHALVSSIRVSTLCSVIVRVSVVLKRTVGDSDWRFDNLSGRHLQSHCDIVPSVDGMVFMYPELERKYFSLLSIEVPDRVLLKIYALFFKEEKEIWQLCREDDSSKRHSFVFTFTWT